MSQLYSPLMSEISNLFPYFLLRFIHGKFPSTSAMMHSEIIPFWPDHEYKEILLRKDIFCMLISFDWHDDPISRIIAFVGMNMRNVYYFVNDDKFHHLIWSINGTATQYRFLCIIILNNLFNYIISIFHSCSETTH